MHKDRAILPLPRVHKADVARHDRHDSEGETKGPEVGVKGIGGDNTDHNEAEGEEDIEDEDETNHDKPEGEDEVEVKTRGKAASRVNNPPSRASHCTN